MSLETKISRREFFSGGAKLGTGLLLVGSLPLLKGCLPNVSNGVIGQPHTIDDIINNPDVVRYMENLVSEGINFPIHNGDNPPNLVGEYEAGGIPLKYVSIGMPVGILGTGTFNFLNQTVTNDIALDFSQQSAPFTQSAKSLSGKISGERNLFTVYSTLNFHSKLSLSGEFSSFGMECETKAILIISGEKKESGDLEGFYLGVPIEKSTNYECLYDSMYGLCKFKKNLPIDLIYGIIDRYDQEDRDFYRAVIIIESNDDPTAVSPVGARGLMQIMPDTWADMTSYPFDFAFDPEKNIEVGISYFQWIENYLLTRYINWNNLDRIRQYELMGAAYNGGIGRLEDNGWNINRMPLETRVYVERIGEEYTDLSQ